MTGERDLTLRVERREEVADGVVSLVLAAPDGPLPAWDPGAHVDVHVGEVVRQYSLTGPVEDGTWRIAVLREPDGRGGSAFVHDKVSAGDELRVVGPRNHFELVDASAYLFVAGGIGITPLVPMVRHAVATGRPVEFVYGGRSRSSMAFVDELEAELGDALRVVAEDVDGRLDLEALLGPVQEGRAVYCCGPEGLLEAIEGVCAGRSGETLHVERFSPRGGAVDTSGDGFDVELAQTGTTVHVAEGESIIDALDAAGVTVDFSCQEGTCGTCETAVLGGVPDHRDSVLTAEEQAANDCMMICVGRCLQGPLVLDL